MGHWPCAASVCKAAGPEMGHGAQEAAAPLADSHRTKERRAIDKAITLQVTQISATQEQVRVKCDAHATWARLAAVSLIRCRSRFQGVGF